ncbi:MAG: CopG family transcriptional regulator [Thermoanaerobaculia bacterium]
MMSTDRTQKTYGIMYGMIKTTVYLPEALKADLEKMAAEEKRSEAEIIRAALQAAVEERRPPRPKIPLTSEGFDDPTAAERVDELLEGFGEW